jgi:hypothetical protein
MVKAEGAQACTATEAGKYGLWRVSVKAQPNTWIEQEIGDVLFRVAARDKCVATRFSRRPHAGGDAAGAYTRRAHTGVLYTIVSLPCQQHLFLEFWNSFETDGDYR